MSRYIFRSACRAAVGLVGLAIVVTANAQYDTGIPTVPSPDYHQRGGTSLVPDHFRSSFFDVFIDWDSPISGPPGNQLPPPGVGVDSFFDIFYEIDFYDLGNNPIGSFMGNGNCAIRRLNTSPGTAFPQTFDTEMLAMNLSGNGPVGPFMIRESPTLPSLGKSRIDDIGGGMYHIDSFFDVFTELSLDGGQTWRPMIGPNQDGSAHLTPSPEPASMAALGVGLLALLRRHKKAKK